MGKSGMEQQPIGDGRKFKGRKNTGYRQDSKRINYGVTPEDSDARVNPIKLKKDIKDTAMLRKATEGTSGRRDKRGS